MQICQAHKRIFVLLFFSSFVFVNNIFAITTTATAVGGGTWATATWSNGVPTAATDAVINSGVNLSVNTAAVCGSLSLGSATSTATTLSFTAGGSLTISGTTGNLSVNPSNVNKAFTIAVGTQTLTIANAVSYPTTGTSSITLSTGTFSVGSLIVLGAKDVFTFTGPGTANFNGGLSDGAGSLTTFSGCSVKIGGNYTVTNAVVTWVSGSTCIFTANSTVTPTTAITFNNVQLNAGTVTLAGSITVNGNWTNNGGSLSGGANTVFLKGAGKIIDGTSSTVFSTLSIASAASYTMNNNNSCTSLSFAASAGSSSLSHAGASVLTVNGNVIVNNPSGNGTAAWNINAGSSVVSGNVTIGSAGSNAARIAKISLTSGAITISGTLSYNVGAAVCGLIDLSGGASSVNLAGSFTLVSGFGTLTPGSSSVFNYNGATGAQTVTLTSAITYSNLNLNNTNIAGASLNAAVSAANVNGNIAVQSGLFSNGGFAIAGNAGKTFSVSNGATFQLITTSGMVTGFGTKTFGVSSIVNYSGAAQSVSAETYGYLLLSGSGIKTASSAMVVNGDFTISGTTQFNAGISLAHSFYGNLIVNTTNATPFTYTTSSVVNFNAPTVPAITSISGTTASVIAFNEVNINNISGFNASHDFSASGNLTIASNVIFTPGASNIISGTGTLTGSGTVYVTRVAATADFLTQYSISNRLLTNLTTNYSAAADQTISAVDYGYLVISANGTRVITLSSSGTIGISETFSPSLTNTTYTVTGSRVNFNGLSAQTISTGFTFYDLSLANAAGLSLAADVNLINTLTITSGTFTSTGYNFTLKSTSTGTARIAAIPSGSDFFGNIIMERYTGAGPTDWRFLSSAVSGATIADWADDFATSGFSGATCNPSNCATGNCGSTCNWPSIYSYDESGAGVRDSGFVAATNVTNSISNGNGFWVYLGPTSATFEATGTPNKFSQSPTITYTSNSGINEDGWNMIANPYPSAIDWDDINWTKTNLDNAVYIYNSSTGSYASYVSGVGVNGGSSYIPSQQSFWVKANASSPVITMVEDVKASANPTYLKTVNTPNTSHYPMAFGDFPIPLNTSSNSNSIKFTANGNGFDDEMVVRFISGATEKFDSSFDAWKMQNLNTSIPSISSVVNDTIDLSINSFPELNAEVSIPIRFAVPVSGIYSIRRDSILMLPMSSCIFLEDIENGNMIDLRSAISYSFTISDTAKSPRFLLHIYAPVTKKSINTHCPNDSSGMAIVKGVGAGPWNYTWKDAGGIVLKSTYNNSSYDTLYNLATGIYFIEVSGGVCGVLTDTFEIRSTSSISLTANFSNVSCNGLSDGYAKSTVTGGYSPYAYLWNTGDTIPAINNLISGNYSVRVTDSSGCFQMEAITISQPAPLIAGFALSADTVDLFSGDSVSFANSSSGALSYSWDFGDNSPQVVIDDPVHSYSTAGTFTVMLIAFNGTCSDTAHEVIGVINSLSSGISEVSAPDLVKAYCNNGVIFLDFDLPEKRDLSISVYNMIGNQIVLKSMKQVQQNKVQIFMNGPAAGIYVLAVDMNDMILSKKILINAENTR